MERITRKIKQGPVDIDYDDSALVVHYDVETVASFEIYFLIIIISTFFYLG